MRTRHSLFPLAPMAVLALAALLMPTSSQALQTFCVSNMSQFNTAFLAGESDDVEMRLVTGTYDLTNSVVDEDSPNFAANVDGTMRIRGGYNVGCGSRNSDPGATVLTAAGRLVWFRLPSVAVDRVRFQSMLRIRLWALQASLDVDRTQFADIDDLNLASAELVLRNSLFTGIGSENEVFTIGSTGGVYLVEHNTFTRNSQPPLLRHSIGGSIRNNIFFDNGAADVIFEFEEGLSPLEYSVHNNLWGSAQGVGNLANPPVGTLTSNPQFVNPTALDFRLLSSSPAINSGFPAASLFTLQDHAGGTRWLGDAPDRGAFESSIGPMATTITVQNTNDSGIGSLRQAILDANASSNVNRIEFDIGSSCGPRNIVLATPLPTITQPVIIDGYTQPGAVRNTQTVGSNGQICIAITGSGQNAITVGSADDVSVTLNGLGFGGFSFIAVSLGGGNGHRVVGSQFGGQIGPAATPLTLAPSGFGVVVGALIGSASVDGVEIGGDTPAERNVFSDATDAAILVGAGADDAHIINNYIGVGPTGSLATEGNRDGVVIYGRNNELRGNVISNNTRHGVYLLGGNARANRIVENRIGIAALCVFGCSTTLGNIADGVRLEDGANANRIEGNIISHNGDDGVVITGAERNAILRNVITDNTEQPIDLGDDGSSPNGNNSVPAPPGAGNGGQNRPVLTAAAGPIASGIATGTLTSANGTYRLDFYSAINCTLPIFPNPFGEPEVWLGSSPFVTIINGTASTDGSRAFNALLRVAGDPDFFDQPRFIVATATATSGGNFPRGTSEVSGCITYTLELFKDGFEN